MSRCEHGVRVGDECNACCADEIAEERDRLRAEQEHLAAVVEELRARLAVGKEAVEERDRLRERLALATAFETPDGFRIAYFGKWVITGPHGNIGTANYETADAAFEALARWRAAQS